MWIESWGAFEVEGQNPNSHSFDTSDDFIGGVDNGNKAPLSPDGSTLDLGSARLWVGHEFAGMVVSYLPSQSCRSSKMGLALACRMAPR